MKGLLRGATVPDGLREIRISLLLARSVVVFFAFISLFAFLELRRRLGEDNFRTLVFGVGTDRKL